MNVRMGDIFIILEGALLGEIAIISLPGRFRKNVTMKMRTFYIDEGKLKRRIILGND